MSNRQPRIVMFGHPGGEHIINYVGPRKDGELNDHQTYNREKTTRKLYMPWNDGPHFRKFMKAHGRYITSLDSIPTRGDITFWGECEVATRFESITYCDNNLQGDEVDKIRNANRPKYLHSVYKYKKETGPYLQNTDPFVFGETFFYTNCKQDGEMKKLEAGDIILFGTPGRGGKNTGFKYMELDTIFVVATKVVISKKDYPEFNKFSGEKFDFFRHTVLEKIFERISRVRGKAFAMENDKEYIVYQGATYDNSVNGIYSFVPCRKFSGGLEQCAFGKVLLTEKDFNNIMPVGLSPMNTPTMYYKRPDTILNCYRKHIKSEENDETLMRCFWKFVADIVLKQGCCLGIEINEPKLEI